MSVEKAFEELVANGFEINKVGEDVFLVVDNGKFGFIEEEEPFVVDGDEILEIHQTYLQ
jgi:hypothetical protein